MEHISRLLFVKPFLNREARFQKGRELKFRLIYEVNTSSEANRIPFGPDCTATRWPENKELTALEFATLRIP